jgi:putative ABC transport system ATP-binding protein
MLTMLKIEDITMGYAGKPVINLDELILPEGGQCLVTGSSGGGKTTLLYAIAGLMPILSGRIVINGIDITKLREAEMDHFRGVNIGIIFQTLHLMHSLTVMENLMLASYAVGVPPKMPHIEEVLRKLNIYDKKDALPYSLSQGQAQRTAIARAMLHSPKLIIADEPTSSLDDRNCDAVIALIKEVAQETNAALVIATHDGRVKPHFDNIIHFENAS